MQEITEEREECPVCSIVLTRAIKSVCSWCVQDVHALTLFGCSYSLLKVDEAGQYNFRLCKDCDEGDN